MCWICFFSHFLFPSSLYASASASSAFPVPISSIAFVRGKTRKRNTKITLFRNESMLVCCSRIILEARNAKSSQATDARTRMSADLNGLRVLQATYSGTNTHFAQHNTLPHKYEVLIYVNAYRRIWTAYKSFWSRPPSKSIVFRNQNANVLHVACVVECEHDTLALMFLCCRCVCHCHISISIFELCAVYVCTIEF